MSIFQLLSWLAAIKGDEGMGKSEANGGLTEVAQQALKIVLSAGEHLLKTKYYPSSLTSCRPETNLFEVLQLRQVGVVF